MRTLGTDMMRPLHFLLLLALPALLALGCDPRRGNNGDDDDASDDDDSAADDDDSVDDDDDSVDDDDDTVTVDVIITSTSPEPGSDDFFFAADLWLRFDRAPDSASLILRTPLGVELAATDVVNGTLMTLDPADDLTPSAAYELVAEWSPCNGCPITISFETGPYGEPVSNPASTLVGQTYNVDLASATFVEPPGVGPILQSQIGDIAMLFSLQPESDFSPSAQPGLQIVGAYGDVIDPVNNVVEQEPCMETIGFTMGVDGEIGTADDTPASWNNPTVELGPTDLEFFLQGIETTMQDVVITGTFHPDGGDSRGGVLAGKVDTRPLAPELDPEGGDDAICNLFEDTIGIECEPCRDDGTEPFCLSILAVDVRSERINGLELQVITCQTIIDMYLYDGWLCQSEATDMDADADGVYELCGGYAP